MSRNVGIRRGGYKRLQTSSTRDVRECQGANSHMFEHLWWLLQKSYDREYVQTLFSTSIQRGFTWHMFLPASFPSLYLSQRSWNRWTHLDEARNFSSLQGFWALCFLPFESVTRITDSAFFFWLPKRVRQIAMVYSMFWATSMFELDFLRSNQLLSTPKGATKEAGLGYSFPDGHFFY